jgi:hypothetical protein
MNDPRAASPMNVTRLPDTRPHLRRRPGTEDLPSAPGVLGQIDAAGYEQLAVVSGTGTQPCGALLAVMRLAVVTKYRLPRRHVADESPDGSFSGDISPCDGTPGERAVGSVPDQQVRDTGGKTVAPHDTAKPAIVEARLGTAEGRLLATMPLHAITAIHGEDGLRARLLIEVGRGAPPYRSRPGADVAVA